MPFKVNKINFEDPEAVRHREISITSLRFIQSKGSILSLKIRRIATGTTTRVIDLIRPWEWVSGLIVAPPRTGKTMMLQNVAHAISENHPDAYLLVLLIDERPEEVTDMDRSVKARLSVQPSMSGVPPCSGAEMVIEKAKRLVEHKRDVIILLDQSHLARAGYWCRLGKVLTGGVDANALQRPKRWARRAISRKAAR